MNELITKMYELYDMQMLWIMNHLALYFAGCALWLLIGFILLDIDLKQIGNSINFRPFVYRLMKRFK